MAKIIPIDEHFQHFLAEMKESFWRTCMGRRAGRGNWSNAWTKKCTDELGP